ncbi:hypothetical protein [Ilumatobacter nonamiensis]|uniref:hypothetical protein n=1 Tax=Ilumatobacter nonamiensis TaxID=467093 RepID=UPI0003494ECC|nr:hypothetical protein [Ilumatobacter nonamiensis]
MNFCDAHRLPRAHVDPVDDHAARLLISSVLATPPRPESFIVFLDADRCASTIMTVSGTDDPDAILDIAAFAGAAASGAGFSSVVLASVRADDPFDLDDAERWLDIDAEIASAGVELVEWYVIGPTVSTPRSLIGEPPRWAA